VRAALAALAAVLVLVPAAGGAQPTPFEGVITMKMAGGERGGGDGTIQYYLRDNVVRMEMSGARGEMAIVMDPKAKKSYMIMPAQQMYMEQAMDARGGADASGARSQVTRTGKTETIAGLQCEHWLIKDDQGETDACLAKGIGTFMNTGPGMGPRRQAEPEWYEQVRKEGLFPLKITQGGGRVTMEVTKIERKSLDPSLFAPPAGFRKMEMPGGMPRRP
jgi:hypothetical protein